MKKIILYTLYILTFFASNTLMAKPGIEMSDSGPDFATTKFQQTTVDMRVKVAGGYLTHSRYLAGSIWQFNPNWAKLEPHYEDGILTKVTRNRYVYKRSGSQASPTFSFDERNYITKNILGFRWQDRKGNWIEYDNDGYSTSYGDLNGTTATLVRDDNGQLNAVQDRNGNVIFSYTYESHGWLQEVQDYSGRKVTYTWEENDIPVKKTNFRGAVIGGNLITVNDVRGKNWSYSYSSPSFYPVPVLTSMTDPNGNIRNIQFGSILTTGTSSGGGTTISRTFTQPYVCADWAGGEWVQNEVSKEWEFKNYRCITKIQQSSIESTYLGFEGNVSDWQYLAQPEILTRVSDELGLIKKYQFRYNTKKEEFTTVEQDGDGGMMATTYNLDGDTSETIKNGRVFIQRTESGNTKTYYDENGYKIIVAEDNFRNPLKVTYEGGATQEFQWDNNLSVITRTIDENRNVTNYTYDAKRNLTSITRAAGSSVEQTYQLQYNTDGYLRNVTLPATNSNNAAVFEMNQYDSYGNSLTQKNAEGYTITFADFTVTGEPQTIIDGRGNTWELVYDAVGNVIKETTPLGNITEYKYDDFGNLIEIKDPNNRVTNFTYDKRNRLIEVIDPLNAKTTFQYNLRDMITRITDSLGHSIHYQYDLDGNLIKEVDGNNNEITQDFGFNTLSRYKGLVNEIQYPTYQTKFSYDKRYRLTEEEDVSPTADNIVNKYRYDEVGNLIEATHGDGLITEINYDALNRISSIVDAAQGITQILYDQRDHTTQVINANNIAIRKYEYDQNGNVEKEIFADNSAYSFSYDGNNNLTRQIDAKGQVTTLKYDADNRLIGYQLFLDLESSSQEANAQKAVSFTYDNLGLLTSYDDGTTQGAYTYDNANRLLSSSLAYGAFTHTSSYTYYSNGLKKSFTGPDGITVSYSYDTNNQLQSISIPGEGSWTVGEYEWEAAKKILYPGGLVKENTFDDYLRLHEIDAQLSNEESMFNSKYEYDVLSNITSRWIITGSATSLVNFEYNEMDRLVTVNNSSENQNWSYDGVGNRTTEQADTWLYNARDQLVSKNNLNYDYDLNGSLTTISHLTEGVQKRFVYDLENRLQEVKDANGNIIASYYYDPFDKRLSKTINGESTYFFYSQEGLVAESDNQGNVITTYGFQPDTLWGTDPVYIKQNNQYGYYFNDQIGTPQMISNSAGQVLWSASYSAFGSANITISEVTSNLRYAGQYYDSETSLHYNHYRYYDPLLGRYITADPIGLNGGINNYEYAYSNPTSYIDPNGQLAMFAPLVWTGARYVGLGLVRKAAGRAAVGAAVDGGFQAGGNLLKYGLNFKCYEWDRMRAIRSGLFNIYAPGVLAIAGLGNKVRGLYKRNRQNQQQIILNRNIKDHRNRVIATNRTYRAESEIKLALDAAKNELSSGLVRGVPIALLKPALNYHYNKDKDQDPFDPDCDC